MRLVKSYCVVGMLILNALVLGACSGDRQDSAVDVQPPDSGGSDFVGVWTYCINYSETKSESVLYEIKHDETWIWTSVVHNDGDCKGAGDQEFSAEGTYSIGSELMLPPGIVASKFDFTTLVSSDPEVKLGQTCHSLIAKFGRILVEGDISEIMDCSSSQLRHEVLNFARPYVNKSASDSFQDQDHVLNGTFDGCFSSAEFGTSRRYVTTQSNGIYDDFAEEYVGEQCQGDFTAEERYEGYYYTEGFAGTVEGYDYYDVVWVPAVLDAQSPEFNTCFSRVALRDDALYFMSDLEGEACKPYGERDELIPNYDQPMYRQPE